MRIMREMLGCFKEFMELEFGAKWSKAERENEHGRAVFEGSVMIVRDLVPPSKAMLDVFCTNRGRMKEVEDYFDQWVMEQVKSSANSPPTA